MNGQPLVSVVMTSYNCRQFVREAIQSVQNQTWPGWELIIVDDASTDGSAELIQDIRDPRIRLLVNDRNMQISRSRNRGCEAAAGDYIAFLDCDDVWKPEKLSKQVSWMEAHPETGTCFTWLELMDGQGNAAEDAHLEKLYRTENRPREVWLHDLILSGNCLADDSGLTRRNTMRRIQGCRPGLVQLQDLDRWIRVLLEEEIHVIQEPLLRYRRAGDGSSISAPSPEKFHRHYLESAWIVGNTIRDMEDKLFRAAFRQEMKRPGAETPDETEIEKALLLCSDLFENEGVRFFGFEMMEKLLRDEKKAGILRDLYGFTQLDLYRMTGKPILFDPLCGLEEAKLRCRVEELEGRIRLMEGSRWWKLGQKVRSIRGSGKEAPSEN